MRLAVLTSHPVQYYGPLFRELATRIDLNVFFAHRATPDDQALAGFDQAFDWDVDPTSGYPHTFLQNVARRATADRFLGCDTPSIARELRKGGFDAVLMTGWGLKSYLQGLFAAKRLGLPVVVRGDSHIDTPRSRLKRVAKSRLYPPFLRSFDAAAYVGERSRAYYEHYGYPRDRLFFSPHCVDTQWFADRATRDARDALRRSIGVEPSTTLVLFAGKLIDRKRPLDIVQAAACCRAGGDAVEILVAGDGALRGRLLEAAGVAGVPIHFLGFCNQTAMPAAYAAADCLVLPSDVDTWGLVTNEALACDRPIIVSDACGCAPDFGMDQGSCRVYRVGDVAGLARAIEDIRMAPHGAPRLLSQRYDLRAAAAGLMEAVTFVSRGR